MKLDSSLVSLPNMVASSTMDPESVGLVRDYVNELMAYVFHRIISYKKAY